MKAVKYLAKSFILIVGFVIIVLLILQVVTMFTAKTPPILDKEGQIIENSISEMMMVELNGRKQWITIRGKNVDNPVILFLAGGPGGSQLAATRRLLKDLEKDFVVVNWDQPGAAKSYNSRMIQDLTPGDYLKDGRALTQFLKQQLNKDQIYMVGESWGSFLGIMMANASPEDYAALITTGQMVDFDATEVRNYKTALSYAKENDTDLFKTLKEQGPPPYHGKDMIWKASKSLMTLTKIMSNNPDIHGPGYDTFIDVMGPEYTLFDKVNYFRGMITTFNTVYPLLYDYDLRTMYPELKIPVVFVVGKHDLNAPQDFSKDYFEKLKAPEKEYIVFEHSGHSPWVDESMRFMELIRDVADRFPAK